jgi:hypothetical protein
MNELVLAPRPTAGEKSARVRRPEKGPQILRVGPWQRFRVGPLQESETSIQVNNFATKGGLADPAKSHQTATSGRPNAAGVKLACVELPARGLSVNVKSIGVNALRSC